MIRKMLVIAAAVAMPASALAAVTTVGASGVAGAAKTYTSQTCAITGGVTFAAPGLSANGSLTKKTFSQSVSSATATGTGCGAGVSGAGTVSSKIKSSTTDCNIPPVPPATNPAVCASATTKIHYAYDTTSSLATAGVASIAASLSKGLKVYDNGNKVTAQVTLAGTSSVVPGGACGANVGFELSGNTNVAGLTYDLVLCIVTDSGPGTSGAFFADFISGNPAITIATGGFANPSHLTFVKV